MASLIIRLLAVAALGAAFVQAKAVRFEYDSSSSWSLPAKTGRIETPTLVGMAALLDGPTPTPAPEASGIFGDLRQDKEGR